MRQPPYDDPDAHDGIRLILGVLLVIAIFVACIWLANDTNLFSTTP